MMRPIAALALIVLTATSASAQRGAPPSANPRVSLLTSKGTILLELAARRASITTANFLRYVDEKRFDGTSFYRAIGTSAGGRGFIQGGIRHSYTRMLPPIALEPTTRTGLRHVDGTISMARTAPGTAMGDFFITVGAVPSLDAHPGKPGDNLGYAAFGHVVGGKDVVRRILAALTVPSARRGAARNPPVISPVRIITARRVS